ncbi:MAG: AAA family ATPase [Chloroflexota bacterium]|nr:AAA family ATPase [Chloroflexota bacterium]
MRISRLRLQNVKRHADLALELAPRLTVIRGPNEAGKSTIQRAIEIGLFRRATSAAQELDGVKRWGSGEASPTVVIGFEDEGVSGELTKVFAGQRGVVELRMNGEVQGDPAAVDHVVTGLTGLPTEKFFRATASVHHHELPSLDQDEGTLRDRLQQSMSGATRGTYTAKKKLDEAIRRYRAEGPKNPGLLKLARTDVARLEAAVAHGEAGLRQLETDRHALARAREQRQHVDAELAQYQQGLTAAERAATLEQRAADAQRRYGVYRQAAELRAEIGRLEASHPSSVAAVTLKAAVERLRSLEFRLSEMRAELASEPDLSGYELALPNPNPRRWAIASAVLAAAAVVSVVGGALAGQLVVGFLLGVVLGLGAAAAAYGAMRGRRQLIQREIENELRESEIARRLRGRSQRAEELREAERDRDEGLASIGVDDLASAEKLLTNELEHVARIEAAKAEYRGLLGAEQPREDVAVLRDAAAAEAEECRHALAGMGDIGAAPAKALAYYRSHVQRLTAERERALQGEAHAEARLEANTVDAERVAADTEALAGAVESLRMTERRLRVYEQTLAALNEAERATMKKAARFLEQRMATDVGRITGGRYRRLRVDESNLRFSVFSVELNDWVDVQSLSQGTLDQLYLCARLGIVRQVTQPASPPLIFDDPFVTFDDHRARRAFELLRDIAGEHQVIFLTCSERYDDLADKVITLAGPEAVDSAPDAAGDEDLAGAASRVGGGNGRARQATGAGTS